MNDDERYMRMALDQAARARDEGNEPYGAVIVRGAQLVAGRNLVHTTSDPTAHSEVNAIRNAGAAWATIDLRGARMYTSFEPCPMCCGAIMLSGIGSVIIGARRTAADAALGQYRVERLLELAGQPDRFSIRSDVLTAEAQRFYRTSSSGA
ncbi:MAG: nucleoside deaminase [Chloroflexi bacterium]|nr:nucleoside deaminase [Chloroflexota bacterium]